MKKSTKKFIVVLAIMLMCCWICFFLLIAESVKPTVKAFCVTKDGTVVISQYYSLIFVSRDGSVKTVKCKYGTAYSMEAKEAEIILFLDGANISYDLSSGRFGNLVSISYDTKKQNLGEEIYADGSKYSYVNLLGRYKIYETTEGNTVIRYEMPLFDYFIVIGALLFGTALFLSVLLFIIHLQKNYNIVVSGWMVKYIPKE